jgi:hypothetical protein
MRPTLIALVLSLLVAACGTSGSTASSELPTGAEIGEKVSKRTEQAERDDTSRIIIASSDDGAAPKSEEDAAATSATEPEAPDENALQPLELTISEDGEVSRDGKVLETLPKPEQDAQSVVITPDDETPNGRVVEVMDALRENGWTTITIATDSPRPTEQDTPPSGATPDSSKDDTNAQP